MTPRGVGAGTGSQKLLQPTSGLEVRQSGFSANSGDQPREEANVQVGGNEADGAIAEQDVGPVGMETVDFAVVVVASGQAAEVVGAVDGTGSGL